MATTTTVCALRESGEGRLAFERNTSLLGFCLPITRAPVTVHHEPISVQYTVSNTKPYSQPPYEVHPGKTTENLGTWGHGMKERSRATLVCTQKRHRTQNRQYLEKISI
jgi:hypothetical protein